MEGIIDFNSKNVIFVVAISVTDYKIAGFVGNRLWQVIEDDVVTDLMKVCRSGSYEKLEKTVKVSVSFFVCIVC